MKMTYLLLLRKRRQNRRFRLVQSRKIPTKRAVMLSEKSLMREVETMLTVRPGSHVHRLITVLGLAGEYPVRSLDLLGNERTFKALVNKLTSVRNFVIHARMNA